MNKETNKNTLLELLHNRFKQYNYSLNRSLAEFTKREPDGWSKFQLIFLNRDAGWEINIGMLIRKNVVEDLYHKVSSFEPKYQKTTPTVGITVENLLDDNKKHRCYLNSNEDIENCVYYIEKIFRDIALPFFRQYNEIGNIEKAVNVKNGKSIFSGLKYEGNLGVILAKLVRNPDYPFFVEKNRNYYTTLNDGYFLPQYEKLLEILAEIR
ncbi:hypothetical protein HQ865_11560 [Mucilaginibacter mali]|uniref:DUF4304 domain-containing protein n=1 Tax=Mucilaginibacter mali TaxID=2740462 RepID=A0A7D4Q3L3_9SPHI|nr:hypothetical protein [Mucilaginibacter mali]QKJ30367.1 hypothetical protein HQ865_11560 [Mucilaginibacter mali]